MSCKVIVVAHQKGGVGKSTIASSIAVELSKERDISCIDLDIQLSFSAFNQKRIRHNLPKLDIVNAKSKSEVMNIINTSTKHALVFDVGGYDSEAGRMALLGADIIVTPVSDSSIELDGLITWREVMRDIRKDRAGMQAMIVLNRIHSFTGDKSLRDIRDWVDAQDEFFLSRALLRERRAEYRNAYDAGKSIIEIGGKSADEMVELINEIKEVTKWQE